MKDRTTGKPRGRLVPDRRSDEAFRQVVAMIFEGRLRPGSRLPAERLLSVTLKVSRTTLRDALNRLEARGYIERRPKSGNYVCTTVPQTLREPIEEAVDDNITAMRETIELRKVLETWAVEKAAEAPDKGALRELRTCVETLRSTARLRNDGEFDRYRAADVRFHQIIAEMTGNSAYIHLIEFLAGLIMRSIATSREVLASSFIARSLQVHEQIYEALAARDPVWARQAMLDHFKYVEARLKQRKAPAK